MMVFAKKKNLKSNEISKNSSFPPESSLRLTIRVNVWAKMSSNAHYQWMDHHRESAGWQDLVYESGLNLLNNKEKHYLTMKRNDLDPVTLEKVYSVRVLSAPESVSNRTHHDRNYSKYSTFSKNNMIEMTETSF